MGAVQKLMSWLLFDKWDNMDLITALNERHCKVLVIHGTEDKLVEIGMGLQV
jgi:pimeloyl-ACP methyl ester carboxylesterase